MNKKLLAVAIAGALASPMAIADVDVSGSIRVQLQGQQKADGTHFQVVDGTSRLRFKASEDLGNGSSAFANYEFRVDAGKGSLVTGNTQRVTEVGITGGFGRLGMGSQWSTLWGAVGNHIDLSNVYGGGAYLGQYRMNHSIKYSTNMGAMGLSLDAQMNTDAVDDVDRATVGLTGSVGAINYGIGWQARADSVASGDYTGVGFGVKMGDIKVNAAWEDVDGVDTSTNVNIGRLGGILLAYGKKDSDDGFFWANYHHNISKTVSTRIEVRAKDNANAASVILRKDF
jgi:predicted porin